MEDVPLGNFHRPRRSVVVVVERREIMIIGIAAVRGERALVKRPFLRRKLLELLGAPLLAISFDGGQLLACVVELFLLLLRKYPSDVSTAP